VFNLIYSFILDSSSSYPICAINYDIVRGLITKGDNGRMQYGSMVKAF
jgi:hypothetical protein